MKGGILVVLACLISLNSYALGRPHTKSEHIAIEGLRKGYRAGYLACKNGLTMKEGLKMLEKAWDKAIKRARIRKYGH